MKKLMLQWEKEVRKALIDKNMTVVDLARVMNVSNTYMYDILNGSRKADEKKMEISKYLGLE